MNFIKKLFLLLFRLNKVIKLDNKTLYQLFEQEKELRPMLIGLMHQRQIAEFINNNKRARGLLDTDLSELQHRFFKHDEIGKMELTKPPLHALRDRDGNKPNYEPKPILIDGVTMAEYEKEFALLMAKEIDIVF